MNQTKYLNKSKSFNLQMVKIWSHHYRSYFSPKAFEKSGGFFCRNWDERHLACLDDDWKLVSSNIGKKSHTPIKFFVEFIKNWKKTFLFYISNQKVRKNSNIICFNWTFLKQVFWMAREKIVPRAIHRIALRRLLRISGV